VETLFQIIIFVVIVAASVWSELSKNKSTGSSDSEFGDLTAIDDFFKQQEKAKKADQTRSTVGGFDDDAISLETPPQDLLNTPGYEARKIQPPANAPRRKEKKDKKRGKGRDRAALDSGGRELPLPPPSLSHFANGDSDEGPCLDNAPTLFGQAGYEQEKLQSSHASPASAVTAHRPAKRWTRQQLIDSIVLSELLNRYDINRVYSRIPERRS